MRSSLLSLLSFSSNFKANLRRQKSKEVWRERGRKRGGMGSRIAKVAQKKAKILYVGR